MKTAELVAGFFRGSEQGTASRSRIVEKSGHVVLLHYGWAVLAERVGNSYVVYPDWHGYSSTTSRIVNLVKRNAPSNTLEIGGRMEYSRVGEVV